MKSLRFTFSLSIFAALLLLPAMAQEQSTCAFEDGKGIRFQYTQSNDKLKNGSPWTPGGQPFLMFTDTEVTIGGTTLPVGAYGLFVIPDQKSWTLIVSKESKGASEYNKAQDIVRIPMEVGDLRHDTPTKIVGARLGPKQCNIRVYADHWMAWGEILEK